jgi:hypothetical protein
MPAGFRAVDGNQDKSSFGPIEAVTFDSCVLRLLVVREVFEVF